jgi:hypothetical protein
MGKYLKGDHVKIEVSGEQFDAGEWMWMLVDHSDDEQQLVFGELDNEPVVNTDMRLGQQLAGVSTLLCKRPGSGFWDGCAREGAASLPSPSDVERFWVLMT